MYDVLTMWINNRNCLYLIELIQSTITKSKFVIISIQFSNFQIIEKKVTKCVENSNNDDKKHKNNSNFYKQLLYEICVTKNIKTILIFNNNNKKSYRNNIKNTKLRKMRKQ